MGGSPGVVTRFGIRVLMIAGDLSRKGGKVNEGSFFKASDMFIIVSGAMPIILFF